MECSICLEEYSEQELKSLKNISGTSCSHRFHTSCLLKWLKAPNNNQCPICKTVLTEQVQPQIIPFPIHVPTVVISLNPLEEQMLQLKRSIKYLMGATGVILVAVISSRVL